MSNELKVTFQPEGRTVFVLPNTTILEAALRANIIIDAPCGGKGICGKCRVEVSIGASEPNANELNILSKEKIEQNIRLACQSRILQNTTVHIPLERRVYEQKILIHGKKLSKEHILDIPQKDISDNKYGVAIDIGTTTVVGILLNLNTGEQLSVAARTNPQSKYGDDVISRIQFCNSQKDGLQILHDSIIFAINEIIRSLCEQVQIVHTDIYKITAAGNTTMNHLLLNISPSGLGESPYTPAIIDAQIVNASELHITTNKNAEVYTLPNIAGFVGGDIVAGIIASEIYDTDKITLLVDIGTNGEIVLGNRERLICCSTAAGPAFEGARIAQGMRAMDGAIDQVIISDDVVVNVIGDAKPRGLCGTGLVDAVSELLRIGVIDQSGKILSREEIANPLSENILKRIVKSDKGNNFVLVEAEYAENNQSIKITQKDVRELQLAKGAIAAGIQILMQEYNITENDIDEILLAGAFGNYIKRESALHIGILPNIPLEKIHFVGNTASAGAEMVLVSEKYRALAEDAARKTEYIELADTSQFQQTFLDAMYF